MQCGALNQRPLHFLQIAVQKLAVYNAGLLLEAEFEATEDLGKREVRLGRQFDAVTCMFAIHYFFASEQSLDNFFHNVSINLKEGRQHSFAPRHS